MLIDSFEPCLRQKRKPSSGMISRCGLLDIHYCQCREVNPPIVGHPSSSFTQPDTTTQPSFYPISQRLSVTLSSTSEPSPISSTMPISRLVIFRAIGFARGSLPCPYHSPFAAVSRPLRGSLSKSLSLQQRRCYRQPPSASAPPEGGEELKRLARAAARSSKQTGG